MRPPEGPESSYSDLSGLRIPVRFTAETVLQILFRQSIEGCSPNFGWRGFQEVRYVLDRMPRDLNRSTGSVGPGVGGSGGRPLPILGNL